MILPRRSNYEHGLRVGGRAGGKMDTNAGGKSGRGAAAAAVALIGLLAGCAPESGSEPVSAAAPSPPMTITIERGQTLSAIAREHNVPMPELAAANHLSPPYRILAGSVLVIPAPGAVPPPAPAAVAALPPRMAAAPPEASAPPSAITPAVRSAAPEPPPKPVAPTQSPPKSSLPGSSPAPPPAAAGPAHAQPAALAAGSAAATAARGGSFVWPVRGHIVEGYGAGPNGTHNDGINIAAPRGTPVEAADAGVVAYAGNELRGYGNLLLIKHPGGWITAYAHCEAILVKPGQKIGRGQVIARVGSSGNVSTPQLHFELRRGNKAVDPRAYLSALPSVAAHSG
jgi:murein DD-endopeptidase MepM/ murein hydrolase activator NlpD